MKNQETVHYRSWTITTDYDSQMIIWGREEDFNSELIGNSINDSKFLNWKLFKIKKQIDKIIKDQEEKTAKEMLERLGL